MSNSAIELTPWIIITGEGEDAAVALWGINAPEGGGEAVESLAIFADGVDAKAYAQENCTQSWRTAQLDRPALLKLLVDCFRQGIKYATLNPESSSARRVFVIRDVLKAAKTELEARN